MRVQPDSGPFAIVPRWLRKQVSAPALVTWIELWTRDTDGDGDVAAYQAALAQELGVTDRTIRRHISELRRAGALTVMKGGDGQPSHYILHTRTPGVQTEVQTGHVSTVRPDIERPPITEEPPEGPSEATPPREEPAAPLDEPEAPEEPSPVHELITFYFDTAKEKRRYAAQSGAMIIARNIRLALEAGVSVADIKAGIELLHTKGFGPEALGRFIAEAQAVKERGPYAEKPAPATRREVDTEWRQPYQSLTREQSLALAQEQLRKLAGASTAETPAEGSPAPATQTSFEPTPTTPSEEDGGDDVDPRPGPGSDPR